MDERVVVAEEVRDRESPARSTARTGDGTCSWADRREARVPDARRIRDPPPDHLLGGHHRPGASGAEVPAPGNRGHAPHGREREPSTRDDDEHEGRAIECRGRGLHGRGNRDDRSIPPIKVSVALGRRATWLRRPGADGTARRRRWSRDLEVQYLGPPAVALEEVVLLEVVGRPVVELVRTLQAIQHEVPLAAPRRDDLERILPCGKKCSPR